MDWALPDRGLELDEAVWLETWISWAGALQGSAVQVWEWMGLCHAGGLVVLAGLETCKFSWVGLEIGWVS